MMTITMMTTTRMMTTTMMTITMMMKIRREDETRRQDEKMKDETSASSGESRDVSSSEREVNCRTRNQKQQQQRDCNSVGRVTPGNADSAEASLRDVGNQLR